MFPLHFEKFTIYLEHGIFTDFTEDCEFNTFYVGDNVSGLEEQKKESGESTSSWS